ncbi:Uncharacterized protein dnm_030800 [Desulfonema magnum]|uniref:Uncharacterized protein n=1 Tax=Desulfonema magnum TaxID=45655 RepID=A0A975BKG7_9BACT|nr:Uncharacterized protein dnm_030800 [Desulfonema magnum]
MADFFGCVKGGTHPFFPRRHKVSRSLFVVPLCLCVFVADFFGCVKGGTHPKNRVKNQQRLLCHSDRSLIILRNHIGIITTVRFCVI